MIAVVCGMSVGRAAVSGGGGGPLILKNGREKKDGWKKELLKKI